MCLIYPVVEVAVEHGKNNSKKETGLMLKKVVEWYIYHADSVLLKLGRKNGVNLIYWIH